MDPEDPGTTGWGAVEKAADYLVGNQRRGDLRGLTVSTGRERAGANHQLPLRRASRQHIDSACAMAGIPP